MLILLRILKLLVIALAIMMALFAVFAIIMIAAEQPRTAMLLLFMLSSALIFISVGWLVVVQYTGRRQADAVLSYLEQAVRMNLPLPRIVGAIAEGQRGGVARDLTFAKEKLEQGESVTTVLQAIPQIPPRVIGLVAAAERSGRLPQVLARLVEQRRAAWRGNLAFVPFYRTYALFLTFAVVTVISMLMIFVVPKLEAIFKDFKTALPPMTLVTIQVSRFFVDQPWVILLAALVVIAMAVNSVLVRWSGGAYDIVEGPGARLANYLPWFGQIRMHRALGDVFHYAADALQTGRPFETSLLEAGHICGNSRVREKIQRWVSQMERGSLLPDAARDAKMPRLVSGMLATAVRTPDVPQVLQFLGRYYSARFSRAFELLRASIVPMIAIGMGFVVCWVALSMFMPLISLIQAVSAPMHRGL